MPSALPPRPERAATDPGSESLDTDARRAGGEGDPLAEGDSIVVPLARERIVIGRRRRVRGLVRVRIAVRERTEPVELPVTRTEVEIERVPVGRPIDRVPEPRIDGDVTVIPVVEEEVVVTTRLVLKEEIRVRRRVLHGIERQTVVLREEEASIEQIASPDPATGDPSREGVAPDKRASGTERMER